MTTRQAIEYFHLLFSNRLASKVDKSLFCLKGGCNLRFYFNSYRYSEDIDFDIRTMAVGTLKKQVDKILGDSIFQSLLVHRGIEISSVSAPKQTETTQRWKVGLRLKNQTLMIPTKIEFSRRKFRFEDSKTEPISANIINQYQIQNILLQHYSIESAIDQKLSALINRTETQARDIVDLKLLIDQIPKAGKAVLSTGDKSKALSTLASVSFDDFKSQVWPFLLDDFQEHSRKKDWWIQVQDEVYQFIEDHVGPK